MAYDGQHHPKLITINVGLPESAFGPVTIPGLPNGFSLPFTLGGKAADGFATNARSVDFASMTPGADGYVTHVCNADQSGTIVYVCKQGTVVNKILGAIFAAQELIGEGQIPAFTFPVSTADYNCTPAERHEGFNAMIARPADVAYGASVPTLTWTFNCATLKSTYGARVY